MSTEFDVVQVPCTIQTFSCAVRGSLCQSSNLDTFSVFFAVLNWLGNPLLFIYFDPEISHSFFAHFCCQRSSTVLPLPKSPTGTNDSINVVVAVSSRKSFHAPSPTMTPLVKDFASSQLSPSQKMGFSEVRGSLFAASKTTTVTEG